MRTLSLILSLLLIAGCKDSNEKTLHIYTWVDYIDPNLIQKFESENRCKVVIDTYDSNESMYAKLKSGATGYDIITPTSYFVNSLVKDDIIQKLDTNRLNVVMKHFDNRFNDKVYVPLFSYTVPYAISYGCLFYNKSKVDPSDIKSWEVLRNPKYKGRVTILDDIRETIGVGLFMSGHSMNSKSQADIDDAVRFIRSVKPNLRKFDNESFKVEVADGSTFIGHGYSTDALQVICGDNETPGRDDLAISFPKEGFTVSCDEFAIMSDSKEVDLAYAFINFMYQPENCKQNMEYMLLLTPNVEAEDELDDKLRMILTLDEETLRRGHVTLGFDDDPKTMSMYNEAWDRIKSTDD